jgi:hypothetical protein
MAKSVSVAAAHRTETEEAPVSEEEPQVRQLGRPHWHNAAPSNMTGADGRIHPESQFANTGRYAVGTDHKVVSAAGSVAEADRNPIMILQQRYDRHGQPAGHGGHANQQGLLQLGAFYSDERPDAIPEILQIDLAQQFTLSIAKTPMVQRHSAIRNGAIQFERTQGAHRVRLNGHSGAEGPPSRIAFYQINLEALRVQSRGQSEPGNPATDDQGPAWLHYGCSSPLVLPAVPAPLFSAVGALYFVHLDAIIHHRGTRLMSFMNEWMPRETCGLSSGSSSSKAFRPPRHHSG